MGRYDEETASGDMVSIIAKNSFANIPGHNHSQFFLRIVCFYELVPSYKIKC
jgi:hypothetical protein